MVSPCLGPLCSSSPGLFCLLLLVSSNYQPPFNGSLPGSPLFLTTCQHPPSSLGSSGEPSVLTAHLSLGKNLVVPVPELGLMTVGCFSQSDACSPCGIGRGWETWCPGGNFALQVGLGRGGWERRLACPFWGKSQLWAGSWGEGATSLAAPVRSRTSVLLRVGEETGGDHSSNYTDTPILTLTS